MLKKRCSGWHVGCGDGAGLLAFQTINPIHPSNCAACLLAAAAKAEGEEEVKAEEKTEEEKKRAEAAGAYTKFWGGFGKSLKMGIIEDQSNR